MVQFIHWVILRKGVTDSEGRGGQAWLVWERLRSARAGCGKNLVSLSSMVVGRNLPLGRGFSASRTGLDPEC